MKTAFDKGSKVVGKVADIGEKVSEKLGPAGQVIGMAGDVYSRFSGPAN